MYLHPSLCLYVVHVDSFTVPVLLMTLLMLAVVILRGQYGLHIDSETVELQTTGQYETLTTLNKLQKDKMYALQYGRKKPR